MTEITSIPPTVITLTLPTAENGGIAPERATATLLIQRGDLAHIRQFHYRGYLPDVMEAICEATVALGLIEDTPPMIPEIASPTVKPPAKLTTKSEPEAPTISIPLKKGNREVNIAHLKVLSGETDAADYHQAVIIARWFD